MRCARAHLGAHLGDVDFFRGDNQLHEKVPLFRGDPRFSESYEKIFALLLVEGTSEFFVSRFSFFGDP